MTTTTLRTGSVSVDTTEFRAFAKALRKVAPDVNVAMRKRLRSAGEIVATEARSRASFSKTIPPTIKVRVASTTVSVIAGNASVPIAGLMERGNAGSRGKDTFRHPLWGSWEWNGGPTKAKSGDPRVQTMHPFLRPALVARETAAVAVIFGALDEAIASISTGVSHG